MRLLLRLSDFVKDLGWVLCNTLGGGISIMNVSVSHYLLFKVLCSLPPPQVTSYGKRKSTKWVWEMHIELSAPFGEWWLNTFLVCQDEQNREYFDINMEGWFWRRCAVNLFDLQSSEVDPEHYFACQILSWACRVISCECGFGKLILKFHIPGVFSPRAFKPVTQRWRNRCCCIHVLQKHHREATQLVFTCLRVNLTDNPSVILSPLCVGLCGLFTMHKPQLNGFIAHQALTEGLQQAAASCCAPWNILQQGLFF